MNTDLPNSNGDKIEKIIKIIVVGQSATGKTSFIRQYCEGVFSEFYKMTIGVDFASKTIEYDSNTQITIQLWDICGQEIYENMTRVYYKEASAGFVVFDITNQSSFNVVEKWKQDIDEKVLTSESKPIPCILLGNKIDLRDGQLTEEKKIEMEKYAHDHNFIDYFEVSAKFGTNIDEAIKALLKYILDNNIEPYNDDQDNVVEIDNKNQNENKFGGCC